MGLTPKSVSSFITDHTESASPERKFDYASAFSRNLGLISPQEQERLRNSTIAIAGMGGVGGIHLLTLARLGIGGFNIADRDSYEYANFNRQFGASDSTVGQSKVRVMAEMAHDINPEARIRELEEFVDEHNVDLFLDGADVVVDGLDAFQIDVRRMLFMRARERGIPVITAAPLGFGSAILVFAPDGMSFDDYFGYRPDFSAEEKFVHFIAGIAPSPYFLLYMNTNIVSQASGVAPSVASAVTLCASLVSVEVTKLLLGRGKSFQTPYYQYHDLYLMKYIRRTVRRGHKSIRQRLLRTLIRRKLKRAKANIPVKEE